MIWLHPAGWTGLPTQLSTIRHNTWEQMIILRLLCNNHYSQCNHWQIVKFCKSIQMLYEQYNNISAKNRLATTGCWSPYRVLQWLFFNSITELKPMWGLALASLWHTRITSLMNRRQQWHSKTQSGVPLLGQTKDKLKWNRIQSSIHLKTHKAGSTHEQWAMSNN